MDKASLRKIYKEKRLSISATEKNKLEDLMLIQFQKLGINIPQLLMSYIPIEKFNEYNPFLVERYCAFISQEQQIVLPVVAGNELKLYAVNDDTEYVISNYGVAEPVNGIEVDPKMLSLVLTPLLIFDEMGYRVGYGKGFYDRLFARCNKDVMKVGFCFFEPVRQITDRSDKDIPLNYCITPQKTYCFD